MRMTLQVADQIVEVLKKDPLVKSDSVRIELMDDRWSDVKEGIAKVGDVGQIEFCLDCDPDEDSTVDVEPHTERQIERLGGKVMLNDCEGCFGEGVVWVK